MGGILNFLPRTVRPFFSFDELLEIQFLNKSHFLVAIGKKVHSVINFLVFESEFGSFRRRKYLTIFGQNLENCDHSAQLRSKATTM